MNRFASTRSELRASHPSPGRAQCSVGSIDEDGIRYGLTIQALIASTRRTAIPSVSTQSTNVRWRWERFGNRRSSGPRTSGDSRRELATDEGDRVQVGVHEVLEHHPLRSEEHTSELQ